MNVHAVPDTPMTVEQFLDWASANAGDGRSELAEGHIVDMAPETVLHTKVKALIWLELRSALNDAGVRGEAFADGVGVRIAPATVREPDASIQLEPLDPASLVLTNPVVLVEVLSPSSAARDTTTKLGEYFSVPSVRHYLVVDPEARVVVHHARADDAGPIITRILTEGALDLTPPGISVDIASFFPESR